MLAHVVPTVHGTCRMLVVREVCAYSHFFFYVGGMNSSFVNVVLVDPVFKKKK
jgi:hypothetical protein